MINGIVRAREARIRLRVLGPGGRQREIEAVIDTGFTGWLSLPSTMIGAMKLPWQNLGRGILADGNETVFNIYQGSVMWDGRTRRISIDEADTDPLVGMALLEGYELKLQVRPSGKVAITLLPQSG